MTATTTPATLGHRDPAAGALIVKAGKAAASMLQCCKEAAAVAAGQLNPAQPMGERIDAVCALYADDFKAAGHNVRALFKDALTLLAAGQTPVTVDAVVDGKKVEQHTTAKAAVAMPKHAMRDAARQVREAHGFARKTTKPSTKAKAANAAAVAVTVDGVEAFSAWLDNLEEYLTDATYKPRIVARLIEAGYRLEKATQGRKVTGKASA